MEDALAIANYQNYQKKHALMSWNYDQEEILKMWAEKASGWAWLHEKAARYYNSISNHLTYPNIIISTLAGGIGLAVVGADSAYAKYIEYIVAGSHIFCATLTSLTRYMRSSEIAEIHSHMNKVFSTFSRKIVLELTLKPEDRRDSIEFCKACRDEYDKLVTDSACIPTEVIQLYKEKYKDTKYKPEVCNGLIHFTEFNSRKNEAARPKIKRAKKILETAEKEKRASISSLLRKPRKSDASFEVITLHTPVPIPDDIRVSLDEVRASLDIEGSSIHTTSTP
jgi:hypothetical protein